MARVKLTQVAVDRIRAPEQGRVELFDSHLPGFALRVSASGHKSWVLFYRLGGRQRRYTVGTFAAFPNVGDARDRAREVLHGVARAVDPAAERASREQDTVAALASEFIERYAKPQNRTWRNTKRTLELYVLPRWASRPVRSICRRDIIELLDNVIDAGTPIAANRTLAAVRKMFSWAIDRGVLEASPATGVRAPSKEVQRDRVLTDEELARVWAAAQTVGGAAGALFKLLILTGQRRDEVATMRWADLDLAAGLWTLPRDRVKADRTHEVPLPPLAVEVLSNLPRLGEFVITTRGDVPLSGFSKVKARVERLAGVEGWRIHDLRRTAGTGLARLGVPTSTISRVLNHAEGGVTKIYNRYSYSGEKRDALETWAQKVEALVRPAPGTVVQLRAAEERA